MENFKGTKEYWRLSNDGLEVTTSRIGILEGSKKICNVSTFSKELVEAKANAKLIAAAPEMLETLQHIMEYWNGDRNVKAMFDALNHILEQAESVIVKATE